VRPSLLAAGLALTLGACGSSSTPSVSDPCPHPAGFRPVRGELPSGIAPDGTLVGDVHRSGRTLSGALFFPSDVADTYAFLRAGTAAHGYSPAQVDTEGFEADVIVRRRGEVLNIKVSEIQGCSSASAGTFFRNGL
jgi:hypothetical protein